MADEGGPEGSAKKQKLDLRSFGFRSFLAKKCVYRLKFYYCVFPKRGTNEKETKQKEENEKRRFLGGGSWVVIPLVGEWGGGR